MRTLFLFDISAYLHRSMHVVYGREVADVAPTDDRFIRHACGMLANTMMHLRVEEMAVVCDSTEPSFRCDEFPAYKSERKPHPPVFAAQAPRFYDALREMSVAVISEPRYEADDLIASIVDVASLVGTVADNVAIVSSDKDMLAHVGASVQFFDPMKGLWLAAADVRAKFGVEPSQLYDYTGLVGDASDGIPGVPGFGAKTAAKLLREFDSLDEIYSDERRLALTESLSKKNLATLLAHEDDAFLSRRLAAPRICKRWLSFALDPTSGAFTAPSPEIIRRACG